MEILYCFLDQLRKYSLFANLKKCYFHKDDACFLKYVVLFKEINMESKLIKIIKKRPELKSVQAI